MLTGLRIGMKLATQRVAAAFRALKSGIANPEQWLVDWWGGGATHAGPTVDEQTALNYTAFWACVRVASETVGALPLHLYRRMPSGRGRERATGHPLYRLLHRAPNPEMTTVRWRTAAQAHIETWGNHYSFIEWNNAGRVAGLWPLNPGRVAVKRNETTGLIEYHYTDDKGTLHIWQASWVLHVPGWGFDGLVGYSPVQMARQAIGLGLATEEFGARYFGSGTHPGGIFERPADKKALDLKDAQRLKGDLAKQYAGIGKAGGIMLLEDGLTFKEINVPNDTAQFLETRAFQLGEMARIFRLPPHKVGDLAHATFSNIEHQAIEFVTDAILPRVVLWEQELSRALLLPREQEEFYFEFNLDGLLRGDTKSRYEAYAIGRQWGWLSEAAIQEKENMNPTGTETYLVPANMDRFDAAGKQIPRLAAAGTAAGQAPQEN
jgi:HK97 family phage portal protein